MIKNRINLARRFGGAVVALALVPAAAFAQTTPTIDPAPTLALVADAQAFIIAVGMAVLAMLMIAKGIKWARRAG